MALGVNNYGVVGKLSADVVGKSDSGAGNFRMRFYAILPQSLTYLRYRRDAVIPTSVPAAWAGSSTTPR